MGIDSQDFFDRVFFLFVTVFYGFYQMNTRVKKTSILLCTLSRLIICFLFVRKDFSSFSSHTTDRLNYWWSGSRETDIYMKWMLFNLFIKKIRFGFTENRASRI